jgi:hypothetical protein
MDSSHVKMPQAHASLELNDIMVIWILLMCIISVGTSKKLLRDAKVVDSRNAVLEAVLGSWIGS